MTLLRFICASLFFTIILLVISPLYDDQKTEVCKNPLVVDGDTIKCENYDQSIRIIPSIEDPSLWFDAPETSMRFAQCDEEKIRGKSATVFLRDRVKQSTRVFVNQGKIDRDRFQRYLRQVELEQENGKVLNAAYYLQQHNYGRVYNESEHPVSWCKKEEE